MPSKKAFEIQFNWIFVLIAGAAILLFFTVVIVKQKNLSETSAQSTVLKSIEAIVTSASVSTDTTTAIDIPNSNIEFSCGRISIGKSSRQYQSLILFSPSLIKGTKLITQTLAFSAPYRAANLLYLTSPKVRYIIITDSSTNYKNLAREIDRTMPLALSKEYYETMPSIKDKNDPKVKFIVVGNIDVGGIDLANLNKMPSQDVTAIKVAITGANRDSIDFYQKENSNFQLKGQSPYLTKAALMGAVYSDGMEMYECSMKNAFQRLNLVTKVYNERREKLINELTGSSREARCNPLYNDAKPHLVEIETKSLASFNIVNSNSIAGAAEALAGINKKLQDRSCPVIY